MFAFKVIRPFFLSLCLLCVSLTHSLPPAHAQSADPAERITLAALALYRANLGTGNYTLWVGGNLGKRRESLPVYLNAGEPMPEFTVKRLGSPQTIRSQGLKTPYLMNVWASWCPPCREEFPLLTNALESGNLPFALYFLNTGDTQRAANNFLRTQRTGLELLFDAPPDYSFYELLGVKAIPVTFLVGQDNVVQAIHVGGLIPETLEFFKLIAESPGVGSLNIEGAVPPAKPFNLNNPIRLHAGLPHFGVLEDRRPYQVYTIEGSADSLLTVSMRQLYTDDDVNAVDPYLVLLNEAGEVIAFDDDGGKFTSGATGRNREDLAGSEQDALITQFLLPATGRYYLIAARAGYEEGRNAGKYQITLVDEAAFF